MPLKTKTRSKTRTKTSTTVVPFLFMAAIGAAALGLAQLIVPSSITMPNNAVMHPYVGAPYADLTIQGVTVMRNADGSASFNLVWQNQGSLPPSNQFAIGFELGSKTDRFAITPEEMNIDGYSATYTSRLTATLVTVQIPAGQNSGVLNGEISAAYFAAHPDLSQLLSFIDVDDVIRESNPTLPKVSIGMTQAAEANNQYTASLIPLTRGEAVSSGVFDASSSTPPAPTPPTHKVIVPPKQPTHQQ